MTDILLDSDGDLLIVDGDLVIGESTIQHQQLLLSTNKGEWKQSPKVGIGLQDFLNDDSVNGIMNEINYQFTQDGMKVNSINIVNEQLNIEALYI